MRMIDADTINLRCTIGMIADDGVVCVPLKDVRKSIGETPTIDAVPVVRCKDCKWYRDGKIIEVMKFCYRMRNRDGEEVGYSWPEDGFCSYGERKENG